MEQQHMNNEPVSTPDASGEESNENQTDICVVRLVGGRLLGPQDSQLVPLAITDDRNSDPLFESILDVIEDPKAAPVVDEVQSERIAATPNLEDLIRRNPYEVGYGAGFLDAQEKALQVVDEHDGFRMRIEMLEQETSAAPVHDEGMIRDYLRWIILQVEESEECEIASPFVSKFIEEASLRAKKLLFASPTLPNAPVSAKEFKA